MELHLSVEPEMLEFPIFGGFQISETLFSAVLASLIIIIFALIVRIFFIPKFKQIPDKFQMVIELTVDAVQSYTTSKVGSWASKTLAPYMYTVALIILVNGFFELLGIRAAMTDLNFTLSLALITFVLIQAYGIKKRGLLKRLRAFTKPTPILTPVNIATSLAIPISLACRMFGNILGGMIVMELLYSVAIANLALPGILSIYFSVFHTCMQAFIFITLSLTFIHEALED